jgi:hypothetical protein
VEISNLKNEHEKNEALLQQKASDLIRQSDYRYLKLLAKPYVWAIRTEIMKGNIEAVNLYANDMVKEKNFQTITVVDDKGAVISSTKVNLIVTGTQKLVENLCGQGGSCLLYHN